MKNLIFNRVRAKQSANTKSQKSCIHFIIDYCDDQSCVTLNNKKLFKY